jgi:hypothetical protein
MNAAPSVMAAERPRELDTISLEKLFGLADQIQALCITGKTGEIQVTNVVPTGRLNIVDGEVVDAQFGGKVGLEAAIALINLRHPETAIVRSTRNVSRTIHLSYVHVLLEAACRKDETSLGDGVHPATATIDARPNLRIILPNGSADYRINQGLTLIGRLPCNDIVIPDRCISRRHAGIKVSAESVVLRDFESANGTLVDGQRITEVQLGRRTEIKFGTVEAVFSLTGRD